ncbi:MAG: tyrosine-type recombinase/integrase [Alicyclobacillus shizuokensis]|nr:tyrosine-type recombinase/integrase [Alicyclobacillus shizuokensis]
MLLLLETGIRVSECVNIDLGDVHLKQGFIRIHGKRGQAAVGAVSKQVTPGTADLSRGPRWSGVPGAFRHGGR